MSIDRGDAELRRYLLGEATDEECAALEQDYFAREEALDRMSAAESDLIDEYLSNELAAEERDRFESHYLTVPAHRDRVAVARQLRAAATSQRLAAVTHRRLTWPVAIAASVLLAAAAAGWVAISLRPGGTATSGEQAKRGEPTSSAGVIAIALSPATVRGTQETSPLTIAAGVERIQIVLEGTRADGRAVTGAVIRKVGGDEVWRGPAASGAAAGELARLEVPARVLPPEDYVIELSGRDASGRESEWARYVLPVRAP